MYREDIDTVDFSDKVVGKGRETTAEPSLDSPIHLQRHLDPLSVLDQQLDVVSTSYGTLVVVPDLKTAGARPHA
jgi:hypothetical protein